LSVDAMGRITAADGALAAIVGREPPGLIGTPVADLLPGWSHAEDSESVWHGRLRRSDGSEADVRVAAIRDADDACSWHLYLRQSGATAYPPSTNSIDGLREIIDLVPGFLFAKDAQGRFLFVNRTVASAFGDSPERIAGRTDADYGATPEAVAHCRASDNAVLASRQL
jgi:PAS domain-containing protein